MDLRLARVEVPDARPHLGEAERLGEHPVPVRELVDGRNRLLVDVGQFGDVVRHRGQTGPEADLSAAVRERAGRSHGVGLWVAD